MPGIDRAAFLSKLKGGAPKPEAEIEVEGPPDDEMAMGGGEMLMDAIKNGDPVAVEEAVRRIMEG